MRQIRIRRSSRFDAAPEELASFSAWSKATPGLESDLRVLADAGNLFFGDGTHWIEEREITSCSAWPDLEVWKRISESLHAWIAGDIDKHTSFFAPEAIVVMPMGGAYRGRAEIQAAFAAEHALFPHKQMSIASCDMTYPTADAAIVVMTGTISHEQIEAPQPWYSTQTLVRRNSTWLISAHQIFHLR